MVSIATVKIIGMVVLSVELIMIMEHDNVKSVLIKNSHPSPLIKTNPRLSFRIGNVGPQESDFLFETMVIKKKLDSFS